MLSIFCEVGGGFSILKKAILKQIQWHFQRLSGHAYVCVHLLKIQHGF